MYNFGILFKKEMKDKFKKLSFERQHIKNTLLSIFLTLVIVATAVIIFRYFVSSYINIKVDYEINVIKRCEELFSMVFILAIVCAVIISAIKISNIITNQNEIGKLMVLPISTDSIFWVKMISIAMEIIYVVFLMVVALCLTICIVAKLSVWCFIKCLLFACVLSVVAFAFGSLLALPYYYLKRYLKNKFWLTLIIFAVLVSVGFIVYSNILQVFKAMLESGQIKFLLNENTLRIINKVCSSAKVSHILALMTVGEFNVLSFLYILFVIASCMFIAYIMVKLIFNKVLKTRSFTNAVFSKKYVQLKEKSQFSALIKKEFTSIIREPSYAFQYFVISITLPLFVYSTATILISMVNELIFIDCSFEICLLCMAMFSVLTNTFCATNISRDNMFYNCLKILPIKYSKMVYAKVFFCSIVSFVSIFITCLILLFTNYVTLVQFGVLLFSLLCLSFGEICLATRKDLNKPSFSKDKTKATPTVNFLVFWGFLASLFIGGITLASSVIFDTMIAGFDGKTMSFIIAIVCSILIAGLSLIYLNMGLEKKVREVVCHEE